MKKAEIKRCRELAKDYLLVFSTDVKGAEKELAELLADERRQARCETIDVLSLALLKVFEK